LTNLWDLNGELERDFLVREGVVNLSESIKLSLDVHEVLGIKKDLKSLSSINLVSNALANNFGRVDNVLRIARDLSNVIVKQK
jgi:hypothetical protein